MKRLTKHHVNKAMGAHLVCSATCMEDDFGCENCGKLADAIDRLAAYEDTGLEPEEIIRLVSPPSCDPLTLEELREMDGEPVWVVWAGHPQNGWALVRVWSIPNGVIYLTYNNGVTDLADFVLRDGGKFYRRKPEENDMP